MRCGREADREKERERGEEKNEASPPSLSGVHHFTPLRLADRVKKAKGETERVGVGDIPLEVDGYV